MRTDLYILHDTLSGFNSLILVPDSLELSPGRIRRLPNKEEHQSTEYTYAVTTQELISAYYQTDKRSLTFLCQGNADPPLLMDKDQPIIIILESANYNGVLDTVQNTFEVYRK